MGNSPVDKSKDFIKSGKTLITDISSDRHLNKINKAALLAQDGINPKKKEESKKEKFDWADEGLSAYGKSDHSLVVCWNSHTKLCDHSYVASTRQDRSYFHCQCLYWNFEKLLSVFKQTIRRSKTKKVKLRKKKK